MRCGIHTGEIEKMGDDIGGIAVHVAARVMDEAQSGEVLATSTVRDLCDQAIWMDQGVLRMWDEPDAVIDAYTEFLEVGQDAVTLEDV